MPDEFYLDLERIARETLKAQPEVSAPPTLIPRVLAAIEARSRLPWWSLSWWNWPITARTAFCLAAACLIGAIAVSSQFAFSQVTPILQSMASSITAGTDVWTRLDAQVSGLTSLGDGLAQPWVWFAAGLSVFCYLTCVGVGTLVMRLAWNRT